MSYVKGLWESFEAKTSRSDPFNFAPDGVARVN